MFYCPDYRFFRLFPTAGSKIITEQSSSEDSPCLESDKLSNRPVENDDFAEKCNLYSQLFLPADFPYPLLWTLEVRKLTPTRGARAFPVFPFH
jgi:hypothetical protein